MLKHHLRRSSIRIYVMFFLVVITVSITISWPWVDKVFNPLNTGRWFRQQPLDTTYHLFDFGVTDLNDDGWLDIYTVNHSARQALLINNSPGEFKDQLLELELNQNSDFPGVGPSDIKPSIKAGGLYIYWYKSKLVVRFHNTGDFESVTGQIQMPDWVVVRTSGGFNITTHKRNGKLAVDFTSQGNGQLTLESKAFFFKPSFKMDERIPLDQIYIGSERLQPNSHEFAVRPGRDRHGMAWADLAGDSQTDVFIVRGGGGGKMKPDPLLNNDELLVKENLTFKDRTTKSGIIKDVCPARQVALVDFDSDGQLDIYTGCGRGKPPRQFYPNQLHWQKTKGKFISVAAEKGLDIPERGPFIWLDADNDQDMDLLFSDDKTFWLYVNRFGNFKPQSIGQHRGKVRQFTIADYDRDGDLDVFAASTRGNALLTNSNGIYEINNPKSVGLPVKSNAANWVDYDNDGLTDLYVFPDGIYRQQSDHRFEATHLLESKSSKVNEVFCTWFDADNDGRRDLLIAIQSPGLWERIQQKILQLFQQEQRDRIFTLSEHKIVLYRNIGAKNHWLQLNLIGSEGNRQAIGTRVAVKTPNGIQLQQVGQAEGSIRSQGHYRLYFGLGHKQNADSIEVIWYDGTRKVIENPLSDQILTIERS